MEKVYSYELSNRLIDENIGSAFSTRGMQLYSPIQYFCRPEIFEKYDMDDYYIRHPSYAHSISVEYPNAFVRAMHHFAVAGYESYSDSEPDDESVYESDTDMDDA